MGASASSLNAGGSGGGDGGGLPLPGAVRRLASRLLGPPEFEDVGNYSPSGESTGVLMLRLPLVNVYLVDGTLIDAGSKLDFGKIRGALDRLAETGRPPGSGPLLVGHAITHAHPDHQGSSARICAHYSIPFLVGDGDVAVAEGRQRMQVGPRFHPFHWLPHGLLSGRAHPVSQALRHGDRIGRTGAIEVVATPGHTRGSVSYWVSSSRVAIVGDVLCNEAWVSLALPVLFRRGGGIGGSGSGGSSGSSLVDGLNGLGGALGAGTARWSFPPVPREPAKHLCANFAENRRSLERVMRLNPRIIVFGHGPPLVLEETTEEVPLGAVA